MSDTRRSSRRRRIVLAVIFILIATLPLAYTELAAIYTAAQHAQYAADVAAFSGMRTFMRLLQGASVPEDQIVVEMLKYATRNGVEHPTDLVAYYVDAAGHPLGSVGAGVPSEARGIETYATVRAHSFLTRTFGAADRSCTRHAVMICNVEYVDDQGTIRCTLPDHPRGLQ